MPGTGRGKRREENPAPPKKVPASVISDPGGVYQALGWVRPMLSSEGPKGDETQAQRAPIRG